jgi:hypothetical protein
MLRGRVNGGQNGCKRNTHAPIQASGEKEGAQVTQKVLEPLGHAAGVVESVSSPSHGRNEGVEAWTWRNWPQTVPDDDMAGGGVDEDSMDSRTTMGLVWQRRGRRGRKGPSERGERGEGEQSGTS